MKQILNLLLFIWLLCLPVLSVKAELKEKLTTLPGITQVEELQSDHYKEKYVVKISQLLDHQNPSTGDFLQRVIVCHVGYDRPTVIITEGYGAGYGLRSSFREEISQLLNANVVLVEHRYFLESMPDPLNWDYLTAENSAYDLHQVRNVLGELYPEKWISTGISKGGQTSMIYKAYFPDDVDFSVPYVAPLNRAVEDKRQEVFLKKVGTEKERKKIEAYQKEVLKRKEAIIPLMEEFTKNKNLTFRISMAELIDYCVLEYSFALWQWGTPVSAIPALSSDHQMIFDHLVDISGPDYFSDQQPNGSFFVQAARELGYYGYQVKPFKKYLTIKNTKGYLHKIMLPESAGTIKFSDKLYKKVYNYLKENDPKMLFIHGQVDPWSATRVPDFKGKKNMQTFIQPKGSHRARIGNMPEDLKEQIMTQLYQWLEE